MKKINNIITKSGALVVAMSCFAPSVAYATNGMFMIGTGTKSRGMGGVGITMTHDVLASVANPATMVHVGDRFDIGGDIMFVKSEATMGQAPNIFTEESKPEDMTIADGVYLMPNLGASWNYGDISYGFTMVPVGGGGSRYNFNLYNCANSTPKNCDDPLGVTLMVMNVNPTIAYKINDQHSVGATLVIGFQYFRAFGLTEFTQFTATQDDTAKFTNEGSDIAYGAGVRFGWLGNFLNGDLALGASFTSQTYMTEFESYVDLFAEHGQFNTPGNIGIGASYKINKDLLVAVDVNYIMYEDVAAVANPGANARSPDPFPVDRETNALGLPEGLGFGWENQTVLKLGVVYDLNPTWTLRGGWNYGKSPIDEETDILFSLVAPAITQNHLTLGATYQINKSSDLSFSYIHAFEYTQYGPTYINYEAGYTMSQDVFGASYGLNF